MADDFSANELRTVQTVRIGHEQNPVVVIDDYLSNPDAMMNVASTVAHFSKPKNWYPGLRGEPFPQPYIAEAIRRLHPIIGETFGLPTQGDIDANSFFGLVTVLPSDLVTLQRLPHFDTANLRQVALLLYLCDASHGGTVFFRHRSTGYESISEAQQRTYYDRLDEDMKTHGEPPARYMSGDNELFDEIGRFEAKFNRMIIYRSRVLHSANVNAASGLSRDPRAGRLTANVLLAYR